MGELIRVCVDQFAVNPNKVTFIGYSAGGDGMYRLSCRMTDRFSTACAFAGHPGDKCNFEPLKNISFALGCGLEDKAYDRHKLA